MLFLIIKKVYLLNIGKGEIEVPDCSEMNQYQTMQNILSQIDYSAISNLSNVSLTVSAFTKDESFIKLQKNMEQLEKNGILKLAKTVRVDLPSMPKVNLDVITAIQDKFQELSDLDFSAVFSISNQLSTIDIPSILKKSVSFTDYDFDNMVGAIQKAFTSIAERQETVQKEDSSIQHITLEDIVNEIQSEYVQEEITEKIYSEDEKKVPDESIMLSRISIIIAVITLLWAILSTIGTNIPQTYFSYLSYKNSEKPKQDALADLRNYEKVEVDTDSLNEFNYRVVCHDNVIPRIYHDCKSRVTGHLEKGKIVIIVNRYKKWIEIIWQNDDGKFCSGWVQNYKVTKFK